MPLYNTAQRNSLFRPALDDYYVFPEAHKPQWFKFFESMEADEDKILDWAEKSDIKHPKAWYESLHKFLFDMYSGTPKMLKKAAKESFQSFLKDVHSNHIKNPKPDYWYRDQDVTPKRFIEVLKEASEIKDLEQTIAYINARMMNLGFYLYSEYILSKTEFYKKVKHVASDFNRQAYDLECLALGKSPVSAIKEGDTFTHFLSPKDKFTVENVVWDDPDHVSFSTVIARNEKKAPVFFTDPWNIKILK
jgi:hypothetical protein